MDNALPSVSTIRKWCSSINREPGFSGEAFDLLKLKAIEASSAGKEIYTCLMFDEMHMRQHQQYDNYKDDVVGHVNYGTNIIHNNDEKPVFATQALVYMVTGVEEKFKLPVGYFLVDGLKKEEKAALTQEVLLLLSKTGVKVIGLTFDGLEGNVAMCKEMGVDFEGEQPFIQNPHSDDKIFIFLDACHMLKLARNCLARNGVMYDDDGKKIRWVYFERLYEYQRTNKTNIGNKLTKAHIVDWAKKKMNVRLASETLSNSVADSMEILKNKQVKGFAECDATVKYIRFINNIFDIMNSNSGKENATHYKRAISPITCDEYFSLFEEAICYIDNLKLVEKKQLKSVLSTKSKVPFFGFKTNMKSFKALYQTYVQSGIFHEVATFRFSQDHLELYFSCIRQMFGCNDNPTAQQLKAACRKLLAQNQIEASRNANVQCNDIQLATVLNISSKKQIQNENVHTSESVLVDIDTENNQVISTTNDEDFIENEEIPTLQSLVTNESLNDIQKHVTAFTAANLEKCILEGRWNVSIKCYRCLEVFDENSKVDDEFISIKKKSIDIRFPCESTVKICELAEAKMKSNQHESGNFEDTLKHVLSNVQLDDLYPVSNFENHPHCKYTEHKLFLVKLIVDMYYKKKLIYISRCNTLAKHDELLRHHLKKIIHAKGQ